MKKQRYKNKVDGNLIIKKMYLFLKVNVSSLNDTTSFVFSESTISEKIK